MPSRLRLFAAAALAAAMILPTAACGRVRQMPPSGSGTSGLGVSPGAPSLKVLAFYDPRAEPPGATVLPLVNQNRAAIWQLAPLWYHVMPDGTVRDLSRNNVKNFARQHGIQLMPLVINNNGTSQFLLNAGNCTSGPCATAVNQLASVALRGGYDGLNIDFELLKPAARAGLTAFAQQLATRLHGMNKVLTLDVIPAGSRRQADQAYNFPALAKAADDIVLMTYDAHDDGSAPGPVAPLAWVKKRVDLALSLGVPANRLIVGLADYGYDWTVGSNHATTLGLNQIDRLIAAQNITVSRTNGEPHFTYTANGAQHVVWYEDQVAIVPKIQLARRLGVKGLALWMAGYETAAYWSSLRSAAGTAGLGATLSSLVGGGSASGSASRSASTSVSSSSSSSASGMRASQSSGSSAFSAGASGSSSS